MEASGRAGEVWRLPSEEGLGDLSRRWQPRPTGEPLPDPTRAGLVIHDPRRARHGDVSDHQAG